MKIGVRKEWDRKLLQYHPCSWATSLSDTTLEGFQDCGAKREINMFSFSIYIPLESVFKGPINPSLRCQSDVLAAACVCRQPSKQRPRPALYLFLILVSSNLWSPPLVRPCCLINPKGLNLKRELIDFSRQVLAHTGNRMLNIRFCFLSWSCFIRNLRKGFWNSSHGIRLRRWSG